MGNVLESPATEKDTIHYERADTALKHNKDGHGNRQGKDTLRVIPGDEFSDGIAAAASSMQGWRSSMEDRVCARMDLEGCPLGVRHMFCLFDGHGGDSVAEYCRTHLADRIVQHFWALHAARTAAAGEEAPSNGGPGGRNSDSLRNSSGSRRRITDVGSEGVPNVAGEGGSGRSTTAAVEPSLVADCVRDACREVDAQVRGMYFTRTGRYVAPRKDDSLDVTPPQQTKTPAANGGGGLANAGVNTGKGQPATGTLKRLSSLRGTRVAANIKGKENGEGEGAKAEDKVVRTVQYAGRGSSSSSSSNTVVAETEGGSQEAFSTCGTTSLIVLVSDLHVICCNTGDSRAVLASEGASRPLSTDHKPERPSERNRIEAAGGNVEHNRVEGKLAVSRCIGDHFFKSNRYLPLERQMVVCDPEVTVIPRSDADEFVIMACDGVWDVMSNDDACFFLRKSIEGGNKDLGSIIEHLEDACLAKQSMDNMSVVVIAFKAVWEEGLHLHKSARFILQWGRDEVLRWLSNNNFGQYEDEFDKHEIDGVGLLGLTEADLHHKLHLKKVGLRKKLWQKLSPLRLGYLSWSKREMTAWLGHIGLKGLQGAVVEADIDGQALSTKSKGELKSLARGGGLDKRSRRRLYAAVEDLKSGLGADGEWVAFYGGLDARYHRNHSGGGGDDYAAAAGDARYNNHPAHPLSTVKASAAGSSSSSTSSSSCGSSYSSRSDSDGDGGSRGPIGAASYSTARPGADSSDERGLPDGGIASWTGSSRGRHRRHRSRHGGHERGGNAAADCGGKQEEAPVVVGGQGFRRRSGSILLAIPGARRLSQVLSRRSWSSQNLRGDDDIEANGGNAHRSGG